MISLTGDVHHMSLQINDQQFLANGETETGVTRQYVGLLERYGVKATLYVCGRCFLEEWETLEPIATHPLVEVGGHMFNARFPRECFDAYGRETGLWNGPRWYQDWDIGMNVKVAREHIGKDIISWRNHSYIVDANTHELLAGHGIRLVSDSMEKNNLWPKRIEHGLINHPLNCISDHDHLFHAHRTPEYVEQANARGYGADEFGAVSYTIEQWGKLVMEQAESIDGRGGIATILAHPLCMYLADRFKTLERLLEFIAGRRNIWACDILDVMDARPESVGETG